MRIVLLAMLGCALVGCTTARSMMIDANTAIISADDLGWGGDVDRKALITAAQMAQQRGFDKFVILDSADKSRTGFVAIPGSSTTTASCIGYVCSAHTYGNAGYVAPYTQTKKALTVRFYHAADIPPGSNGVFDVASILGSAK